MVKQLVLTNKILTMNAKLTQSNFKGDVSSIHLNLNGECTLTCACANITDFNEVSLTVNNLRKMAYAKVDDAIDKAVGDFMKGKLKQID